MAVPGQDVAERTGPGPLSTVARGVVPALFLTFDQFPRLVGRTLLVVAVVLAVPLLISEVTRPSSRSRGVVAWVLLAIGVLALPGFLRPPETEYGQQKLFFLVTLTLLAALSTAVLRGWSDWELFCKLVVLATAVLAVAALTADSQDGRSAGFGSNPIWLGRAIGVGMLAVAWLYFRRRLSAVLTAVSALLLVPGLLATGSRGPLLATAVGLFALALAGLRRRERQAKKEWVGVTMIVGVVLAITMMPWLRPIRLHALLTDPEDELFNSARGEMFDHTLSLIRENPWGVGYGNWSGAVGLLGFDYPHNLWLELPAEAGWLIAGALVLSTALVAMRLWVVARSDARASLGLGLLLFSTVAVSTSGDINGNRLLFIALALGLLILRRAKRGGAGGQSRTGSGYLRRPGLVPPGPADVPRRTLVP
ncbi:MULTISPECIES: O-antigen ligase family protein [unclassified Micromonospora]|uniref:O-antigen ligase family protein n=1 Tax=unclassified Micromonospora TaxID=2617518 RepID=UPI002FEED6C4